MGPFLFFVFFIFYIFGGGSGFQIDGTISSLQIYSTKSLTTSGKKIKLIRPGISSNLIISIKWDLKWVNLFSCLCKFLNFQSMNWEFFLNYYSLQEWDLFSSLSFNYLLTYCSHLGNLWNKNVVVLIFQSTRHLIYSTFYIIYSTFYNLIFYT